MLPEYKYKMHGEQLITSYYTAQQQALNDVGATGVAFRFTGDGDIVTDATVYVSAITGTGYYSATIETDSSGSPSGTPVTGGDAVTGTVTGSAQELTISGWTYQTVIGTPFWIVMRGDDGADGSNYLTIRYSTMQAPLKCKNYTTSWQTGTNSGLCMITSGGKKKGTFCYSCGTSSYLNLYDLREAGNILTVPEGSAIRVSGALHQEIYRSGSPTGSYGIKLYKGVPGDGGVVASISGGVLDPLHPNMYYNYIELSADIILEPGEVFALVGYNTEPTGDSSSNFWRSILSSCFSNSINSFCWGNPTAIYYNGSTWTQVPNSMVQMLPTFHPIGRNDMRGPMIRGL